MNKAQELRELRNKILYNGEPPLEFGCEVVKDGYLPEYVTSVIANNNGIQYTGNVKAVITHATRDVWLKNEIEILGKPVEWGEILIILNKMSHIDIKFGHSNNSELIVKHNGHDLFELELKNSPEEQSAEVLKKLIDLIK